MTGTGHEGSVLLVDASVCITLADVGAFDLLDGLRGDVVVPGAVCDEVTDNPARDELDTAIEDGWIAVEDPDVDAARRAAAHLGVEDSLAAGESDTAAASGDVALLAAVMERDRAVVVSDDRPLRETCKALSIPVSGSPGVVTRAVERGELDAEDARGLLYAMDEVGARLSATLVRRAERLIDAAVEARD